MKSLVTPLVRRLSHAYPRLKTDLRMAHISKRPEDFIYDRLKFSIGFSIGLTVLLFFIVDKADLPLFILPIFFVACSFLLFRFGFLQVKAKIVKRQKEIDREVLFAGQYLLIKLYSGKPLLNALIDSTKSYGVASKYIKEIVDDIDTGSPIEKALSNAMRYSPSAKFKKILFQINNALKLGIDVTVPLKNVLAEIAKEQELEVKRYGKSLNSLVIFYLLAAIVVPSIGMTVFIVISSFINFTFQMSHFFAVLFFLFVLEILFIGIFRSIRPTVNL